MSSIRDLSDLIARFANGDGSHQTEIPQIWLYRASCIAEPIHSVYEPSFCIVAQGSKRSMVADKVLVYDEAKYLVIKVDVPIVSEYLEATPERPFLCLRMKLNPATIAALMIERGIKPVASEEPGPALVVSDVTSELIDASARMSSCRKRRHERAHRCFGAHAEASR